MDASDVKQIDRISQVDYINLFNKYKKTDKNPRVVLKTVNGLYQNFTNEDKPRYYHTWFHIATMNMVHKENFDCFLRSIDETYDSEVIRDLISFAILFHDIVYDRSMSVTDSENVDDSADYSALFLKNNTELDDIDIFTVFQIIKATDHSNKWGVDDNIFHHYMRDLDLFSFSWSWEQFSETSERIRKEFSHVDDIDYLKGRIEFLTKMKYRGVFSTSYFLSWEDSAQKNIERELDRLKRRLS